MRLKGEDFLQALGCERAESFDFEGVSIYRLWGTEPQIKAATAALEECYAGSAMRALGHAVWLGKIKDGDWQDFYELLVVRKA